MQNITMTSSKPYIINALNDWIEDNELTTYLIVNTEYPAVNVPKEYIDNEKNIIILNISTMASINLNIDNDYTTFTSRFNGQEIDISFPTEAILALKIKETNALFPMEMKSIEDVEKDLKLDKKQPKKNSSPKKADRSHLTIVKK